MANKDPALFYFWAHDDAEDLKTDTCRELVRRADIIFNEGVTPDVSISTQIERDLNDCSRKGVLSDNLRRTLEANPEGPDAFLLSLTRGTCKRYVLEEYPEPSFGYEEEKAESRRAFLRYGLEEAMLRREDFLMASEAYNIPREKAAAVRIAALDGTVLAILGSAHPDVRKIVALSRPTEVHFPYPNYPRSYSGQESANFRQTGVLDQELFLRNAMEMIARAALNSNPLLSRRERETIANAYASLVPLDKIEQYPEYLNFCVSFASVSPQEVFESFLKKESLPLVPEMLAKIKKV
jgi:hypothetical protein